MSGSAEIYLAVSHLLDDGWNEDEIRAQFDDDLSAALNDHSEPAEPPAPDPDSLWERGR